MKWIVTVELLDGPDATVTVIAQNKQDAEYRACFKIETERKAITTRVKACRKC